MSAKHVEQLREAALNVLRAHPVTLAYLYGSQAGGRQAPLSDIAVAVVAILLE